MSGGPSTLEPRQQRLAGGIMAAMLTTWLAYLLVLPPWEGFDETAHYSYIAQLADRREIPDFRTTPLDAQVQQSQEYLPRPYVGTAPFEANGGLTYAAFFRPEHADRTTAAAEHLWAAPETAARYAPGSDLNWQGQHPPLFYAVAAVPYRLTAKWSLGGRLLVLRLLCWGLAAGSLVFWYLSLRTLTDPLARRLLLGAGGAVLLIPSLNYDLAWLGDDSLAALCLSAAFYFAIRATQMGSLRHYTLLAMALGCGLLTKAFFVPVTAGVILYLCGLAVWQRDLRRVGGMLQVALGALLLAGWWFALLQLRYGDPLVTHERLVLSEAAAAHMTWMPYVTGMLRGGASFAATALWCGSWSWVHRPYGEYLLMGPLLAAAGMGLFLKLWRRPLSTESRMLGILTLLMLGPVVAGFAMHILMRVQATGIGSGTGGYYLFFAWPLVGLVLAGMWDLARTRVGRWWLTAGVVLALAFEASGFWYSLQIYAGIVEKLGEVKQGVGAVWPTPANLVLVFQRLGYLAFPTAALACYVASLGLRGYVFRSLIQGAPETATAIDSPTTSRETAETPRKLPLPEPTKLPARAA